jgi:carbonic anhydrase
MNKAYTAKTPFHAEHPDALAIYCSDGRFTEAVEELVHASGHGRLDALTLPGGAALFEVTTADFSGLETMRRASSFLIEGHGIEAVFLVAHEGCGYYRARHAHADPKTILRQQVSDLRSAARWLLSTHAGLTVRLFLAAPDGARIVFRPMALESRSPPVPAQPAA